jgi:hypothetical protein
MENIVEFKETTNVANWCFTSWSNPKIEELPDFCNYIVYGKEKSGDGKIYWQGYIELKQRCRISSLGKKFVKYFDIENVKFQPRYAKISTHHTVEFCKKGTMFLEDWKKYGSNHPYYGINAVIIEFGKTISLPAGKRTDLKCCIEGCTAKRACYGFPKTNVMTSKDRYCVKHKDPNTMIYLSRELCEVDGCMTRASLGIPGGKPRRCSKHKESTMEDVTHKKCAEKGCNIQPGYGDVFGKPTHCAKHRSNSMRDCVNKPCEVEGCLTLPTYGNKGGKKVRCSKHKTNTMVELSRKKCDVEGCNVRASFGLKSNEPTNCKSHKSRMMTDVVNKKVCEHEGCAIAPSFGFNPGNPLRCLIHKSEKMFNVLSKKMCQHEGCKIRPSYGITDRTHCLSHKSPEMKELSHKKCEHEGCEIRAAYATEGERPKFCIKHKPDDAINVTSKKCEYEGCKTTASFGFKDKKKKRCFLHRLDGMENILSKRCLICPVLVSNEAYEGYCLRCFIHMFPDKPASRNYKTKEKTVVDHIISEFPDYEWIEDKQINGGFSACRPDLLLELKHQFLIIEIDENQHAAYNCYCDNNRTVALAKDIRTKPVVFIRFNPDGYTNSEGDKIKSCWKSGARVVCSVPRENKKEWNYRLEVLIGEINYWLDKKNKTGKLIETVQLFYDGMIDEQ